ncbi:hypothetical protein J8L88_18045 [Aquimarina sp. MMG015]|uniref:hypothetical protein n=1 Tax=Aquimarina TaxID=290174 RepID=UPI0003F8F327|nr:MULTISPECIES: hypothetical protein [Aquimarina]AXT54818.1 hypothetical protein D1815_03290 [Aquimarina sp. AD1]MBQ4804770.1 hypothetical protein [Aquimarina sp. MMG015]RKN14793.1 hypothetical protein D7035_16630 [Aquimarina sp. AD1]
MKPTFVLYFCVLSFTLSFGQDQKQILADIKSKYSLIRELVDNNTLRQYHTDYTCEESLEKGAITFYYNSRELKHIIHQYTQGHVSYKDEYYIWDDQLFFEFSIHKVKYKDYEKNRKKRIEKVDVVLTLEERFYFDNFVPIKCQFKDFETRSNRIKNPKTNYVRNQTTDCDQSSRIIEKYYILLEYQDLDIVDACALPRSISKIVSDDIIYSSLGKN